jgi:hypothetical protein
MALVVGGETIVRVSFDPGRTDEFIVAACVPRDDHASGTLEAADSIRGAHPRVAADDIYAAAVVGDFEAVERLLGATPRARLRPADRMAGTR